MALVDYKGLEILDPEPTGAGGLAIQDNFVHIADMLEELPLENNDAVVYVRRGEDDVESAANLRAAYAAACALTPGGNALSATNRAVCLVPPGRYDFGTGDDDNHGLILDTEFVYLVSLTGRPETTILTSVIAAASRGTLEQTADDVLIRGFRIENMRDSSTGVDNDSTRPAAYFPLTDLANAKVRDCVFVAGSGHVYSMRIFIEYSGTFTNCVAGTNSYGSAGTASGTFINCVAGSASFGGNDGTQSGKCVNCRVTLGTFTTPQTGAKLLNCLDGNGQIVNWPNGTLVNLSPVDDELGDAELASRNGHPVSLFPQSVDTAWISTYDMPTRYSGHGLAIELLITSTATSGNFVVGASFERIGTTQDIDSDSFASEKTVTTAISGTSGVPVKATIEFSNSEIDGLLSGERFRLKIRRVGTSGSDTITGAAIQLVGGQIRGAE